MPRRHLDNQPPNALLTASRNIALDLLQRPVEHFQVWRVLIGPVDQMLISCKVASRFAEELFLFGFALSRPG